VRVLAIVHSDDAGPGVFLDVFKEEDVTVETWEPHTQPERPTDLSIYDAVIAFGGVANPPEVDKYPWIPAELDLLRQALKECKPILGVCLGCQMLAEASGTRTRPASIPEVGFYDVKLTRAAAADPIFSDLPAELITSVRADSYAVKRSFEAVEWHEFEVPLPPRATALAKSDTCLQAYRLGSSAWGVQFHPEVTAEDFGKWLDEADSDASWNLLGLDRDDLQAEVDAKLERWNEFGRTLVRRFLGVAAERKAAVS
jgi:GMP synthase (glutamine-hydrolysing)